MLSEGPRLARFGCNGGLMLGDLELSTETQTQLYREYSPRSSLPLVSCLFLAQSIPRVPCELPSPSTGPTAKILMEPRPEYGAREKITLGGPPRCYSKKTGRSSLPISKYNSLEAQM